MIGPNETRVWLNGNQIVRRVTHYDGAEPQPELRSGESLIRNAVGELEIVSDTYRGVQS